MSKELVVKPQNQIAEISPEQVEILRKTLFKEFDDSEIQFALAVCSRTGLDPFSKQIHFRKQRSGNEKKIVIITGIDGFRLSASRTRAYAGSEEPVFEEDEKGPIKATVVVYKMVQGAKCSFTASARWDEFYPGDTQGAMWRKMPYTMLGKCAEAQALRKAFPAELSGIYSTEEMAQADNTRELVPTKAAEVNQLLQAPAAEREVAAAPEAEIVEPEFNDEIVEDVNPADYVIPIGQKYKGKKLSELSPGTLKQFRAWVDETVQNKTEKTKEFLLMADAHLKAQALK